jgi:hypothetical protein
MTRATSPAEDVSNALFKAMSTTDATVDHYRQLGVWDMAIVEALAVMAKRGDLLPAHVASDVLRLVNLSGTKRPFARAVKKYLSTVGVMDDDDGDALHCM